MMRNLELYVFLAIRMTTNWRIIFMPCSLLCRTFFSACGAPAQRGSGPPHSRGF